MTPVSSQRRPALAQTGAMIVRENTALELGCNAHGRSWDRVEKGEGVWRIGKRESSYDMSYSTFLACVQRVGEETVRRYPRE